MEEQPYTKREIPRIAGSAAAFIAVVVILACITIVSCTAVVYILREDMAHNRHEEQVRSRTTQDRYGRSRNTSIFGSLGRVLGVSRSRQQPETSRTDKSRSGWMQARNASEWDLERAQGDDINHQYARQASTSTPMRTATPLSSNAASLPPSSRIYVPGSDYEHHGGRGYSFADQSSIPRHSVIPSIQYSPPSSPASPSMRHPTAPSSSESLQHLSDNDSTENIRMPNPFADTASPSVHTFSSGSKFVEAL
ncbi:hypothetical protein HYPSUDRAFT_68057 [Hypholoma sublateritium FD-334 SS-4]|uniref:Uncharacterized protein n=1 Tax=Hypholoma sublateritium (strain FD-334 SS-4) TaxID=945553 RepID=A0A0D2NX80_HYPSF|nr:hypothetical protein HYPSUDRAFT_68057 [Hypholoma sublateritium FD-334 SS-4]